MRRALIAFAATLMLAGSALAQAPYNIDPAHSTAEFSVKHMMITNVKGHFSKVTGTVNIDDNDITKSTVDATIDASTIDTGNSSRDNDLKSANFFDVQKYPTLTFKSKKVEKNGDRLKVTGDLTMHGVTKEVVLDVEGPSKEVKVFGGLRRAVSANTKLNRRDFGVNYNRVMDNVAVVSDEVSINLELELVKQTPAAATAKSGN